jgi:membrane associated rhomboid family serine protease
MLSDRAYMRDDYHQPKTSVLVWLIVAIVAGFLLQTIFLRWFGVGREFTNLFALTIGGLQSGKVWTLLTYSFLHSPANLMHIVGNLLGLYFLGRELLPIMGERRFLGFYATAVLTGGLLWTATNWNSGGVALGASAGVSGLLIIFACLYPNRQITFLLFFVLPVTLKPKYVAWVLLGLDLCGFVFYEVMGAASPFGFAHSAHLGGMFAGWIYFRYVHEGQWRLKRRSANFELPKWARRKTQTAAESPRYQVNISSRSDLKAEVDRILDKINSQGFGSLTDEEKRVLDSAKDMLSRR